MDVATLHIMHLFTIHLPHYSLHPWEVDTAPRGLCSGSVKELKPKKRFIEKEDKTGERQWEGGIQDLSLTAIQPTSFSVASSTSQGSCDPLFRAISTYWDYHHLLRRGRFYTAEPILKTRERENSARRGYSLRLKASPPLLESSPSQPSKHSLYAQGQPLKLVTDSNLPMPTMHLDLCSQSCLALLNLGMLHICSDWGRR